MKNCSIKLLIILLITAGLNLEGCKSNNDKKLTLKERTIVGGLYFGMPQDSVEALVGTGLNKCYFKVNKCWQTTKEPSVYYYINSFDYSEFKIPGKTAHIGIVLPVFFNKKLFECYVMLVNEVDHDISKTIHQYTNWNILAFSIPSLLTQSYGKDSVTYNENALTMAIEETGYNKYKIPSLIHTYKPKFGTVEFTEGYLSKDIEWRVSEKAYICWVTPMDSSVNANSYVHEYPCIHYQLDPKFEEQLEFSKTESNL